jgi:hypothetical protein
MRMKDTGVDVCTGKKELVSFMLLLPLSLEEASSEPVK